MNDVSIMDESAYCEEYTHHVTAHGETVCAPIPVLSLVAHRELSITKDLIRLRLRLKRELGVDCAAIDQEGHISFLVFLQ